VTLGLQLINELARRRELGMYFNFADYRALRGVDSPSELVAFLSTRGFSNSPLATDVVQIADWLPRTAETRLNQNPLIWLAFDPLGGIIALPVWLFSRLARRRD
jgi:hypothetical protein